jgi:hypothetical protein
MLKLDERTRGIPVVTYTTEFEGQEPDDDADEAAEGEMFVAKPAIRMN